VLLDDFGLIPISGENGEEGRQDIFFSTILSTVDPALVKHAINSVEAQQWVLDRYETAYRIFDHNRTRKTGDEYALVRFHPEEDTSVGDILYERLKEYKECCVQEHTGVSFKELLEFPRHMVVKIFEQCRYWEEKKPKIPTDLKNLERALK
jgi:hypothetical protein